MKYIIFDVDGLEYPLIFSQLLSHEDMARFHPGKPISAGFLKFIMYDYEGFDFNCYGKSVTLNLISMPTDKEIIFKNLEREMI